MPITWSGQLLATTEVADGILILFFANFPCPPSPLRHIVNQKPQSVRGLLSSNRLHTLAQESLTADYGDHSVDFTSHRHLGADMRIGLVVLDAEILVAEGEEVLHLGVDP